MLALTRSSRRWPPMSTASGSWASRPHALSRSTAGRLNTPRPALVEARGRRHTPRRSTASRSRSCARSGASSTAGGPRNRSTAATSRSCSSRARTSCVYRDRERGCWFTQRADQGACRARSAGLSPRAGPQLLSERLRRHPSDPDRALVGECLPLVGLRRRHHHPLAKRLAAARTDRRGALRAARGAACAGSVSLNTMPRAGEAEHDLPRRASPRHPEHLRGASRSSCQAQIASTMSRNALRALTSPSRRPCRAIRAWDGCHLDEAPWASAPAL